MSFSHFPLNQERLEIRLFTLHPGSAGQPIEGTLTLARLDALPQYEAISYVWGDAAITKDILLSQTSAQQGQSQIGVAFPITTNLFAALETFRRHKEDRVLWIDAICINQQDRVERCQQVQLMQHVYGSAQMVLAWTGPATDGSDQAMYFMRSLPDYVTISTKNQGIIPSDTSLWVEQVSLFHDVEDFLTRQYWTRIWVFQELTIPSLLNDANVSIFAGKEACSLDTLINASVTLVFLLETSMIEPKHGDIELPGARMAITLSHILDSKYRTHGQIVLPWLLHLTNNLLATEARDRIYGLLAICQRLGAISSNPSSEGYIAPDYGITLPMLRRITFQACVHHSEDLSALEGPRFVNPNRTPSWDPIPEPSRGVIPSARWTSCFARWNACGSSASRIEFLDDATLVIKGQRVDRVMSVTGPCWGGSQGDVKPDDTMLECIRDRKAIVDLLLQRLNQEQKESLWRVMIMDEIFDFTHVEMLPAFEELREGFATTEPGQCNELGIRYWSEVAECLHMRCIYTTDTGIMGVGPFDTCVGDELVSLDGGKMLYILRELHDMKDYRFIGDSWAYGGMQGDFRKDGRDRTFHIK